MKNDFSISQAFRFGWDTLKERLGLYVGATFLYFIALIILEFLSGGRHAVPDLAAALLRISVILFGLIFSYGRLTAGFKAYHGHKVTLEDFYFSGTLGSYANFIVVNIVLAGCMAVLASIVVGARSLIVLHPIGCIVITILCIIAALWIFSIFFFLLPAVVDGKTGLAVFKESFRLSKGIRLKIIGISLLFCLLLIVATIPFGLGLLIVYPMIPLVTVHIYEERKKALHAEYAA